MVFIDSQGLYTDPVRWEANLRFASQRFVRRYTGVVHSNRIFMLMTLSSLKYQFTNLCKFADIEIAVLEFAVKNSIYKPMQIYWDWNLQSHKNTITVIERIL